MKSIINENPINVSYVLATLNRADKMRSILENIASFKTTKDELIIIDGGSFDGTLNIIKSFGKLCDKVISETDRGVAHALNKGILLASGKYVVNLNDDDWFYKDGILKAISHMESNSTIDALICSGEFYLKEKNKEAISLGKQGLIKSGKVDSLSIILEQLPAGYLILRRKICIEQVGLYDITKQANDTDYMSRIILNGLNFHFLDVLYFRMTFTDISSSQLNWDRGSEENIVTLILHGEWDKVLEYPWSITLKALRLNKFIERQHVKRILIVNSWVNKFLILSKVKHKLYISLNTIVYLIGVNMIKLKNLRSYLKKG